MPLPLIVTSPSGRERRRERGDRTACVAGAAAREEAQLQHLAVATAAGRKKRCGGLGLRAPANRNSCKSQGLHEELYTCHEKTDTNKNSPA
ncbi:UNVERIFIED_CONTAM: hypothetical protein K2H54_056212 [Gekko kuhli]